LVSLVAYISGEQLGNDDLLIFQRFYQHFVSLYIDCRVMAKSFGKLMASSGEMADVVLFLNPSVSWKIRQRASLSTPWNTNQQKFSSG